MIAYKDTIKQSKVFEQFVKDCVNNKISQSYLVVGADKETLESVLIMMAETIYCEKNNCCGECLQCRRVEDGNNSNLKLLNKGDAIINVEDIANIIDDTYLTALEDGRKVYLIANGEKMNEYAQNKLLKTLEEPNGNVVIVIGVTNENAILQTIKSRCNIMYVNVWNEWTIAKELSKLTDDEERIEMASQFGMGSIARAKNILENENFKDKYYNIINTLLEFNTSTQLPEYINNFGREKEEFLDNLNILEQIIGNLLTQRNDKISIELVQKFNVRTLANIYDLIIESYKRLNSNCNIASVASYLLLGILEVRMKLS